jgi:hypothetical protein
VLGRCSTDITHGLEGAAITRGIVCSFRHWDVEFLGDGSDREGQAIDPHFWATYGLQQERMDMGDARLWAMCGSKFKQ